MTISAIMPTRGRPAFAARALVCFLSQTYPDKELVIVDDADAPSFPTPPTGEGILYHRLMRRMTIGAKRNLACARSNGDVICHWDDDDFSLPGRMADQIARLEQARVLVTGYHSMLFCDESGRSWMYRGDQHYALGTSLMYAREFWRANPFPDENEGEDNAFVRRAVRIATADAGKLMVAAIHPGNTSNKLEHIEKACWEACA